MTSVYDYTRQIRTTARLTPTLGSANGGIDPWAALDGALVQLPWKQAYVNAGRGFHVTVGAFSTPITGGGAGTVIDLDQPEAVVSVPSGTAIMPIRIHVQGHVGLLATDADEYEILVAVDRTTSATTGGTATAETIFNMRTDNGVASGCTATSAYTGDITTPPTLGIELARTVITGDIQTAVGTTWGQIELLYEPETVPVIHGPALLIVYWGGTVALPGFAQIEWLEFNSTYDPVVGG